MMRNETKGMIAWLITQILFILIMFFFASGCVRQKPSWKMVHGSVSAIHRDIGVSLHESSLVLELMTPESSCYEQLKDVIKSLGIADMQMTNVKKCMYTMEIVERRSDKWWWETSCRKVLDKIGNP